MAIKTVERNYTLSKHTFQLEVSPNELFTPNMTTKLLSKAVRINPGDIVFDIGYGVGVLAIWAALEPSISVIGVEKVEEQYELAKRNAQKTKVDNKIKFYHGSLFDPIPKGTKANVIIADVSGIADNLARVMSTNGEKWYPQNIPTGGFDGTEVINSMLEQAGEYLAPGGKLYFPVASLSSYKKIIDPDKKSGVAFSKFSNLEAKINATFPLEHGQRELIEKVGVPGTYEIFTRRSRNIWLGWIYEATNPIN